MQQVVKTVGSAGKGKESAKSRRLRVMLARTMGELHETREKLNEDAKLGELCLLGERKRREELQEWIDARIREHEANLRAEKANLRAEIERHDATRVQLALAQTMRYTLERAIVQMALAIFDAPPVK